MADSTDITPAILLQHMQSMEQRLHTAILTSEKQLAVRIDAVEMRLGKVERKVDLLSVQIGNMDERLDDLEVVQVPMLKKAVGIAL